MTALEVAQILNGALLILRTVRDVGVTSDLINERLDSGEEVTPEDVQASLDRLQQAINQGRSPT